MSISSSPEWQLTWNDGGTGVRQYLDVVRRRRPVILSVAALVFLAGLAFVVLTKPVYRAEARFAVLPSPVPRGGSIDLNNPLSSVLVAAQPPSILAQVDEMRGEENQQDALAAAGFATGSAKKRPSIKVDTADQSDVITISVDSPDPLLAKNVANAVMTQHLERLEQSQTRNLEQAIGFLREQRDDAEADLQSARRRLSSFLRGYKEGQLGAEQAAQQSVNLQFRYEEARTNLELTRNQLGRLLAERNRQPLDLETEHVKNNPVRSQAELKLQELQTQRVQLLNDFNADSDTVKEVDAQIAHYRAQLRLLPPTITEKTYGPNTRRDLLDRQIADLEIELRKQQEAFASAQADYRARSVGKGELRELGPKEVRLQELTQDRDHAQSRYILLSDRLQDLVIRRNARTSPAKIVQHATAPTSPVWPSKPLALAVTLMTAILLGLGVALLMEVLDDRVRGDQDVPRAFAIPNLGHVPAIAGKQKGPEQTLQSGAPEAEAYRMLRATVKFAGLDSPLRLLQVTSVSRGEGKTTTAVNLATAMAMDGKQVILVDADLRGPDVHRLLNTPMEPGLSELLRAQCAPSQAVYTTSIRGLMVVPAGVPPADPAELLGSDAFWHAAKWLSKRADVVIFDTPPCLPCSDSLVAAGIMDGVVLVLQPGKTRKGELEHVVELLDRARARVVGTIFNQVRPGERHYHQHRPGAEDYFSRAARRGAEYRNGGPARAEGSLAPVVLEYDDEPRETAESGGRRWERRA